MERVSRPASGAAPDDQRIAASLPWAEICLAAISGLINEAAWLAGKFISLADLHAAPMFAVFRLAPEGQRLLDAEARLRAWWDRISARPSFVRTRVPRRYESHAVG